MQGSGDAQEAWCVVLALVVLGWGHAPQSECGEQAQDVLGCGGILEVWSVELTQPVLAGCLYLPCKCRLLAQDAQGCADSQYAEPAGYPGPRRYTGDQEH